MKSSTISIAVLCILFTASPAYAEDKLWSGPYIGASIDASFDETNVEDLSCWTSCSNVSLRKMSAAATFSAGYDVQLSDSLVVGLVADIATGSDRKFVVGEDLPVSTIGKIAYSTNISNRMTFRARAGIADGSTLVYLTGGLARAKTDHRVTATGVTSFWASHSTDFDATWTGYENGFVYGVGIEHKLGQISAKAEVLGSQYTTKSTCFANSTGMNVGQCWPDPFIIPPQVNFSSNVTQIKIGLNLRF